MLRFIYLVLVFIIFNLQGSILAQSYEDSLLNRLPVTKGEEKINTLNKLAKYFYKKDVETSYRYAKNALVLSQQYKYKEGEGDALHHIANFYKRTNNNDTAIIIFEKSIKIREAINDTVELARSHNNIGGVYFNMSKYEKAL